MNLRKPSKALTPRQVKDLCQAVHFAEKRGKKLNTSVAIHPKLLDAYPADIGLWVVDVLNKIRIWCQRQKFGYFAIWVRENYEGDRREHLHLMIYVPERQRDEFEDALRRWLPGDERAVKLERPKVGRFRAGGTYDAALTYILKQMTPQAWWALNKQVRREKACRTTQAPVAAVLGKRCGVSRSLNAKTRAAFWLSRAAESSSKLSSRYIAREIRRRLSVPNA